MLQHEIIVGLDTYTPPAAAKRVVSIENPNTPLDAEHMWIGGRSSDAGETVTHSSALSYSPVWQAVHLISGDVAKLPIEPFRRLEGAGREVDHRHPLAGLIGPYGLANEETTSFKFWRRFMTCVLLWQNAYAAIERNGRGDVVALYNLCPDRTAPFRHRGELWYITEIEDDDGEPRLEALHYTDVLHVEGIATDYMGGCNLVEKARHDFGLALAARKFTSKFFANGAHAGGILQVPPGAKPEARAKVERSISEKHTNSAKAFKTLVLRDGFKWFSTSVDPDKAQLIELDEATTRHTARWFNLAPEFLGVRESVSYNSLEARKQGYLDQTLSHWLIAIKAECNAKLLTPAERSSRSHFIDWNINALLWADAVSRANIANQGIMSGRFSVDETRAWENMGPRPDGRGGEFIRPANMVPASADPPPDDDETDEPAEAFRSLLHDTVSRVLRRLAEVAKRHADRLDDLPAVLEAKHRQPVAEMITAPLAACRAAGMRLVDTPAATYALLGYARAHAPTPDTWHAESAAALLFTEV